MLEKWEIAVGLVLMIVAIGAGLFVVSMMSAVPAAELITSGAVEGLSGFVPGSAA